MIPLGHTRALPPQDHGGNVRQVKKLHGLERIVDFSASINPLGHPDGLKEQLVSDWDEVLTYPDRDCEALRAAVASRFGLRPDAVVPGNGSAELIDLTVRALRPRRLVLSPPDFGLYPRSVSDGTAVVEIPRIEELGFAPDLETLIGTLAQGDLVLFSNPGNPCGAGISPAAITRLLNRCAAVGATLAVDEAFADFCPEVSALPRHSGHAALVVLRSLTKFYGIPGLRLGFLAASPEQANRVRALQVPWSVNALAQAAGVFCLNQRDWEARTLSYVAQARERLVAGLSSIPGLRPLASQANFVLVALSPPAPSASGLYDSLLRRGTLVRHCGSFGLGDRYLRFAVRTEQENEGLVETLRGLVPVGGEGSNHIAAEPGGNSCSGRT